MSSNINKLLPQHIKRSFQPSWKNKHSWLEYNSQNNFMFCILCRATNFKYSAIKEHAETKDHLDLCKRNKIKVPSEHIISLMKIIYCMAKDDLPLNKFKNLTHLGRAIEAPHLIPENNPITYENNIYGQELLSSISSSIENNIWKELSLASAIEIIVDENSASVMQGNISGVATRMTEAVYNICFSIEPLLEILVHTMSEIKNQNTQNSIFDLYTNLCNWQTIAFFYFLQDILTELVILSKFFQTRFLYFYDIYPIIQTTITKLEKTYLDINNNCFELSTNLNKFFISTSPKKNTTIGSHLLIWTLNQENNLMVDIPQYPLFPLAIVNPNNTRIEWFYFKKLIYENYSNLPIDELLVLLFQHHIDSYPNIGKLLAIVYSISFSSVECEHGFSKQNLIKTRLRNGLNNDTLHMLMIVGLEKTD
ncbi:3505_t:CDS:2, partial [Dentiscutata heterogama]